MSGINKVILVGHLGKDPELRHLEGGVKVASFPLATSETYTKDGKKIEQTEWHNIVMWRGLADIAEKFLVKGKLVYIEGKLRTRSWEDKEGHKRYQTEIVADNFTMLGRKSDNEPVNGGYQSTGTYDGSHGTTKVEEHIPAAISANQDAPEDDLPF
ncbi:single-stranded DNA-binding protein [Solitalea sp. MAHUQ-68]|uniref:Single-stranded DNA-binding protein n=1 Tax=Solitalea agri TaxID=2953739 RepID=A0A9X2F364_9SPHI|nr:single-stranded DNA-binding protein [Solitalea agri]MCO4293385.1 single-stranded DNA-binding protein [Solitalea agri]